jgi:hypothetical protein
VPAKVRLLLKRCLENDTQRRLRDIGDAVGIIESTPETRPVPSRLVWTLAAVAAAFLAISTVLMFDRFHGTAPEARLMITSINPPENTSFDPIGVNPPALSPDGRQIVFRAHGSDGKTQLWVRPLDSLTARPLVGTDGATYPF